MLSTSVAKGLNVQLRQQTLRDCTDHVPRVLRPPDNILPESPSLHLCTTYTRGETERRIAYMCDNMACTV